MLVLTRKPLEEVVIRTEQGDINVSIVEIRGDKVRLGFSASKDIPIHRKEVMDQIDGEDHGQT